MDTGKQIASADALERAYSLLQPWSSAHRHERHYYRLVIDMVQRLQPQGGARIMDVGSGIGIIPLALALQGHTVEGMEKYVFSAHESPMFAVSDVEKLRQVWQDHGVTVQEYDVVDMPPSELHGQYDVVINTAVIEHLKAPRQFLENIHRMLKPGGHVITMTPNIAVLYKRLRFLAGFSPLWDVREFFALGEHGFTGHWREYTKHELVYMHEQVGFTVAQAINCNIFSVLEKKSLRTLFHFALQVCSHLVPNSREAHIIVAEKKISL